MNTLPRFSHIKDEGLRARNRGAILANLFEDYYHSTKTASYSYKELLGSMKSYLADMNKEEQELAETAMHSHLKNRGFTYGS